MHRMDFTTDHPREFFFFEANSRNGGHEIDFSKHALNVGTVGTRSMEPDNLQIS